MGSTVTPHNFVIVVPQMQGLDRFTYQSSLSSDVGHCSAVKASAVKLNCLIKCNHQPEACSQWRGHIGSRRSVLLQHRGFQRSVCSTNGVYGTDQDERSSANHMIGAENKLDQEIRSKELLKSLKLTPNEPFVEENEENNNKTLENLTRRQKWKDATSLVEIMARQNQIPHFPSCEKLIHGLANSQSQTEKAAEVLKIMTMSGGIPDVITYNMMIGSFCKRGQLEAAIDIFEDMSLDGCTPDMTTYNTIIRGIFEIESSDRAVAIWKDQLRKGCTPWRITSTILVELVCKHDGAGKAIEVLEDLATEGCYPDIVSYSSLVNITCKKKNYDDTALVLHNLLSHGMDLDERTYNTILHSLCSDQHWDAVDEVQSIMNNTSLSPTVWTYNILLNGLCKCGLLDRAINFFIQMLSQNCVPDIVTYNTLLSGLSYRGMADEAMQLLHLVSHTSCTPNLITYNTVINALTTNGSMAKAMQLYGELTANGITPDAITHQSLIRGFFLVNQVEDAAYILSEMVMRKQGIKFSVFGYMIRRLCKTKKVDVALKVLEVMISSRSTYKIDKTKFANIIRDVTTAGMKEEAKELRLKLIEWKVLK